MNKQTIIDNNARIDALTKRLNNSTFADVRDTTATAGDVLVGKEFYSKDGQKINGTIETFTPSEVTENGTLQTAGKYVDGDIVINVAGSGGGVNGLQWKCDNMKTLEKEFNGYTGDGQSLLDMLNGLDTSMVTNFDYCFYKNKFLSIPNIDFSSMKYAEAIFDTTSIAGNIEMNLPALQKGTRMFQNTAITSASIITSDNFTTANQMFFNCASLETISE